MADRDESALSRWSRLKREAAAGQAAKEESEALASPAPAAETSPPAEADGEEEQVRVEDLPDIDSMTYESDFTAFLQKGVPEELQRLALHRLWRSNPILANLDGLNDYDWDFNKGVGLSDAVKALTPEQGDKAPMPPKEEVMPGRRPSPAAPKREPEGTAARDSETTGEGERDDGERAGQGRNRKLSS